MKIPHQCIVDFIIQGDFNPTEITQFLGIEPTNVLMKGSRKLVAVTPPFSQWKYSTGYIESEEIDIYDLSQKIVNIMIPYSDKIIEIKDRFGVDVMIKIGLWISYDDRVSNPAVGFDVEVVRFLANVGASIDIHTYRKYD